jgi:hypothetical protein
MNISKTSVGMVLMLLAIFLHASLAGFIPPAILFLIGAILFLF